MGNSAKIPRLQRFGEGAEKGPDVPGLEGIMLRFPPLIENDRVVPIVADAHIDSPHDEVMGGLVGDLRFLARADPLVSVSYTHLDVYKRQDLRGTVF